MIATTLAIYGAILLGSITCTLTPYNTFNIVSSRESTPSPLKQRGVKRLVSTPERKKLSTLTLDPGIHYLRKRRFSGTYSPTQSELDGDSNDDYDDDNNGRKSLLVFVDGKQRKSVLSEDPLGEGEFGTVHLGEIISSSRSSSSAESSPIRVCRRERFIAVKTLRIQGGNQKYAGDFEQRLQKAQLSDKLAFLGRPEQRESKVLDAVGMLRGEPVFLKDSAILPMRLIRGISLRKYLEEQRDRDCTMSVSELLEIRNFIEKEALQQLHSLGVMHGDCHLDNIQVRFYKESGALISASFIDFGRSKMIKGFANGIAETVVNAPRMIKDHPLVQDFFHLNDSNQAINSDLNHFRAEFARFLEDRKCYGKDIVKAFLPTMN